MDNFNTHEWNKNRYLTRINENKEFLEDLADRLSSKFDNLDFDLIYFFLIGSKDQKTFDTFHQIYQ